MEHRPTGVASLRALVVDDEEPFARVVAGYLEREGFQVDIANDGPSAVEAARSRSHDIVVLDVMLPGFDGVEACRRLRTFSDAYVIMLTARTDEIDTLVGLSVGADDYLTKPFSPRELVARIKAMLRRPRTGTQLAADAPARRFGDLIVDPVGREVSVAERAISLTRLEFDILDALTERPRMAFTRCQLVERVWGPDFYGNEHIVDGHIARLRHKLGDDATDPLYVLTVRGVGYRIGNGHG